MKRRAGTHRYPGLPRFARYHCPSQPWPAWLTHANRRNLIGFLDAFKAGVGGSPPWMLLKERPVNGITSPLPLAGEVAALGSAIARQSAAGGGKVYPPPDWVVCGSTPPPNPPRRRERGRSLFIAANSIHSPSRLNPLSLTRCEDFA